MRRKPSEVHGVIVVDKPAGPTSHDVVRLARRAFATRSVGHAGTLDPMATGVLVLAVGEATKLVPWLTADAKAYDATVRLGVETDTLDAQGTVVSERPLEAWPDAAAVRGVVASFLGATRQRVPRVSAVRVDGERLHERARRGEAFEAPERDVFAHAIDVVDVRGPEVDLTMRVGKGFYVRSLARDLAERLGTVGHLTALRRTASGPFDLTGTGPVAGCLEAAGAREGDPSAVARARAALRDRLLAPAEAWRGRPVAAVDEDGAADAHHGRAVTPERVRRWTKDGGPASDGGGVAAGGDVGIVDPAGRLVAVARLGEDGRLHVVRGLRIPDARGDAR